MAKLLRKISRNRWFGREAYPWLSSDEIHADAVTDLKTNDNELSVWYLEENNSNFDDIILGVASGWRDKSEFAYAIFDEKIIDNLGLKIKSTPGGTPYPRAKILHRDIYEISGDKLLMLAKSIQSESFRDRLLWDDVSSILIQAIKDGKIRRENFKEGIRKYLTVE